MVGEELMGGLHDSASPSWARPPASWDGTNVVGRARRGTVDLRALAVLRPDV